jgi:hypothetical protein
VDTINLLGATFFGLLLVGVASFAVSFGWHLGKQAAEPDNEPEWMPND